MVPIDQDEIEPHILDGRDQLLTLSIQEPNFPLEATLLEQLGDVVVIPSSCPSPNPLPGVTEDKESRRRDGVFEDCQKASSFPDPDLEVASRGLGLRDRDQRVIQRTKPEPRLAACPPVLLEIDLDRGIRIRVQGQPSEQDCR